jgi:hypothetical protein
LLQESMVARATENIHRRDAETLRKQRLQVETGERWWQRPLRGKSLVRFFAALRLCGKRF